jgi:hypothetical protein
MALDDVVRLVREKDESATVQAALHDMYLRESAERPSYDDFDEKFQLQLKNRGLDNSLVEELAEIVGDELLRGDDGYEKKPEEFAREFIKKTEWEPPKVPVATSEAPTFVEADGFQKNETSGQFFLSNRTTAVFPHTGYPGLAVYYDRQNQLYQHGLSYVPGAAEAVAEEPVSLATDEAILELLDSATNYDELTKAVAQGELVIEYDDEDIESFTAEQFVNID